LNTTGKDRVEKGSGAGRAAKKRGQPHFAPKNYGIFQKIPYKLLNSLLPLILENWKENFEKGKS
jgi:hypothetical protein